MLVVVSDTHSTDGHRLASRTLDAVREADLVVHAGDFMRESVLDAFIDESEQFLAVYGNNDASEIRDRIPEARNFTYGGVEFAMTHTRRGGGTALSLFGRERGADAVIFGHSHRPTFDGTGAIPLLNPGSHAQPRGHRKAHAELEPLPGGGLRGRLVTVDGEVFDTFRVVPGGN
ncbi:MULTISPECIES: metallophosphoesterase [Haloferax]|uniref:Phosphoesterase n=1 Tax=Haloferax marinum TaxID=2666143 RepID=A0A6A8G5T6_9EURY|nr:MULTISPECIES: metallophosphoesterase [Haloferax]KAB1197479.1 metallophosphoesterase [Haloferax sp. CBA1150]MRW96524.1 YfcE family phosphodiesterase [Haloferax marinum]